MLAHFSLRLHPDLHRRIKSLAQKEDLSLNQWIIRAIRFMLHYQKQASGTSRKLETKLNKAVNVISVK